MTEPNRANNHADDEPHVPYITLFFVLLNFTAQEYFYAKYHQHGGLPFILFGTALMLTIVTAILAAVFRFDCSRKWIYLTLIPAIILSLLPVPLVLGLVVLAVTKATLVGLFFMHLKYEGNWVYYMLVPAAILAMVFTFALYPDIGMHPTDQEMMAQEKELSFVSTHSGLFPG